MGIKVVSTGKYPNPNRAAKKGEQDNPHRKKEPKKKKKTALQKRRDTIKELERAATRLDGPTKAEYMLTGQMPKPQKRKRPNNY
jgi:hypothetical protein